MKKIWMTLATAATLFGATYDYPYSVFPQEQNATQAKKDFFMYGNFSEIIRFDALLMDGKSMEDASQKNYDKILNTIKELQNSSRKFYLTVIGHTDTPTDDANEQSVDSSFYANAIQNVFRYSLDAKQSAEISKKYAHAIKDKLIHDGVQEQAITLEYRSGLENASLENYNTFRDKNNRVMVSLYLAKEQEKPKAVATAVEEADTDKDGVVNSKDKCPNTPQSTKVDADGCTIYKSLALKYKTASAQILPESMPKVEEFAEFMKLSPLYKAKIIGHTDDVGSESSNMTLSMARANSVKAALTKLGIDAQRLEVDAKGELEPVADNTTAQGREENRRIEVKLFE